MAISEIRPIIKIIDYKSGVAGFMPLAGINPNLPLEPQVKKRLETLAGINGGEENVNLASPEEVRAINAAIAINKRYVIHLNFPLKPGSTEIDDKFEPEAIEVDVHSSAVF